MGLTIAKEVVRQDKQTIRHSYPDREKVKEKLCRIANFELSMNKTDINKFVKALETYGVGAELARNKKGNIFGIRFSLDGQTFKGSDLGQQFGLRTLTGSFGLKVEGPDLVRARDNRTQEQLYRDSMGQHFYSHASYSELLDEELEKKKKKKRPGW